MNLSLRTNQTSVHIFQLYTKIWKAVFLTLLVAGFSHSGLFAQDTAGHYDPNWTHYYTLTQKDSLHPIDTLLPYVWRYNPAEATFGYIHTGNSGAAATPIFYQPPTSLSFDLGIHVYDIYFGDIQNAPLYQTHRPYTVLDYLQGTRRELAGKIIHSQNINPNWSIGLEIDRSLSDGFYRNQQKKYTRFYSFTRFDTKNNRFGLCVVGNINANKNEENGGVTDTDVFTDSLVIDKSVANVHLDSGLFRYYEWGITTNEWLNVGRKQFLKAKKDTGGYVIEPHFRVEHLFSYTHTYFLFHDDIVDSLYWNEINIDTFKTNDSAIARAVSNSLFLHYLGDTSSSSVFLKQVHIWGGINHQLVWIHSLLSDTQFSLASIEGHLTKTFTFSEKKPFHISVEATAMQSLLGYNRGDYLYTFGGTIDWQHKYWVQGSYLSQRFQPSWIERNYFSNHFQWSNHFKPTFVNQWQASAGIHPLGISAILKYDLITNYIYWNSESLPQQSGNFQKVYSAQISENFQVKGFHVDLSVLLQKVNHDSVFAFPKFYTSNSVFYESKAFQNHLNWIIGFDLRYNSVYYPYGYQPATAQFYIQQKQKYSYYPVADLFASFRVKTVRAFLMVQNINQGLFAKGYYSAFPYPMPDRAFKFGVDWKFWN